MPFPASGRPRFPRSRPCPLSIVKGSSVRRSPSHSRADLRPVTAPSPTLTPACPSTSQHTWVARTTWVHRCSCLMPFAPAAKPPLPHGLRGPRVWGAGHGHRWGCHSAHTGPALGLVAASQSVMGLRFGKRLHDWKARSLSTEWRLPQGCRRAFLERGYLGAGGGTGSDYRARG